MSETQIFLSRSYDAPRARVFRVWTEPRLVALWWGCDGATNTVHEMDVRPGGVWRIDMRVESGTVYANHGVFKSVVVNALLEYSHLFPRPDDPAHLIEIWNRVTFVDDGFGTRVDIAVTAPSAEDCAMLLRSGMREGLGQSLDKLDRVLGRGDAT